MADFQGGTADGGGGGDITRENVQDDILFDQAGNIILLVDGTLLFRLPGVP